MTSMDAARYWVGVLLVSFGPAAIFYWFSIHPFVSFWRRIGMRWTLAVHFAAMALITGVLLTQRDLLMRGDLGLHLPLVGVAAVLLVLSGILRRHLGQAFPSRTLVGVPELDPQDRGTELIATGIYARMRHPRYVQLLLAFLAYALFANWVSCYVAFVVTLVAVRLVVVLEERELLQRFGAEYAEYMKSTPRFLPRWS